MLKLANRRGQYVVVVAALTGLGAGTAYGQPFPYSDEMAPTPPPTDFVSSTTRQYKTQATGPTDAPLNYWYTDYFDAKWTDPVTGISYVGACGWVSGYSATSLYATVTTLYGLDYSPSSGKDDLRGFGPTTTGFSILGGEHINGNDGVTYASNAPSNPTYQQMQVEHPDFDLSILAGSDLSGTFYEFNTVVPVAAINKQVWVGTIGNSWDTSTRNWINQSVFAAGNLVLFNDTATGPTTVNISAGGVSPGSITFDNSTLNYTVGGGPITGSGGLTKNGTGTVTLNNVNTYAGTTTINAGVLQIGALGSLGTGSVVDSASLNFLTDTGTKTVASTISGPGSLVKSGPGTLVLSGANTYSGVTTITAGTLQIAGTIALGPINNTGSLVFGSSASNLVPGVVGGVGSVTVAGPNTVTLTAANPYTGPTIVNGGTLALTAGASLVSPAITVNNGTVTVAAVANIGTGNLIVGGSDDDRTGGPSHGFSFAAGTGPSLLVRTLGTLTLGGGTISFDVPVQPRWRQVIVVDGVVIFVDQNGRHGRLNPCGNDVVVHNGNLDTVFGQIAGGYNGGDWGGQGIYSASAAADTTHMTTIGVILNGNGTAGTIYNAANPFDGLAPVSTDVLMKYTFYGDANIDGKVDGADYSLIDNGYLTAHSTGWYNGDFNYDSKIDGSDYSLIDNAYNRQTAGLSPAASVADEFSAVPEPAFAGFAVVIAAGFPSRRRVARTSTSD